MKIKSWISSKKLRILKILVFVLGIGGISLCTMFLEIKQYSKYDIFLGAYFSLSTVKCLEKTHENTVEKLEKFTRPSSKVALNLRNINDWNNTNKEDTIQYINQIKNGKELLLWYYSILREAANLVEGKSAGCGTIGRAKQPYPIAYLFLSSKYQKVMPYDTYVNSFSNILHINLIELQKIQNTNPNLGDECYFVEIETIEGTENNAGAFYYYYGYVYVSKEEGYRIEYASIKKQVFLCAPYHGWEYDAQYQLDIQYGQWCHMLEKQYPSKIIGNNKILTFSDAKQVKYQLHFITLTNQYDILVGQYVQNREGTWEETSINVTDCLKQ